MAWNGWASTGDSAAPRQCLCHCLKKFHWLPRRTNRAAERSIHLETGDEKSLRLDQSTGEYRRGSSQIAMTPSSLRVAYFLSGASLGLQKIYISFQAFSS